MKHYGLKYQGSKDLIADTIMDILPAGERFVDLFHGGFAMSECAIRSGKYKKVLANDQNVLIQNLVKESIAGVYDFEKFVPEFIDRETFAKEYETNGYIKYCWSFSSTGRQYAYGEQLKDLKCKAKKIGFDFILGRPSVLDKEIKSTASGYSERKKQLELWAKKKVRQMQANHEGIEKHYQKYQAIAKKKQLPKEYAVEFTCWLKSTGITPAEVNALTNSQMSSHYLCTKIDGQPEIPTAERFEMLMQGERLKNTEVPERIRELVYERDKIKKQVLYRELDKKEINACIRLIEKYLFYFELQRVSTFTNIERLHNLQDIDADKIEFTNRDFKEYEHKEGDVVYCDPPYEQTYLGVTSCDDYGTLFDSLAFYEWVKTRPYPVYFSSYEISDDEFYRIEIGEKAAGIRINEATRTEYLYSNRPFSAEQIKPKYEQITLF